MTQRSKIYLLALSFALGVTSNLFADGPIFTTIEFPGAASTLAWGINTRGDIVGSYMNADKSDHGFLLSAGQYSTIDFPGATSTEVHAINPRGDVGGWYTAVDNTPPLIFPTLSAPKSARSTRTHCPARATVSC